VCGEETALIQSIEGERGMPRLRPPFPAESGLWGKPTLINNVETFAHVPRILADGPAAWRARGRGGAAGLKFVSVSGDVERPGVHEVAAGTPVAEVIEACGGVLGGRRLLGFLPGGASTAFLPAAKASTPLSWEGLRAAGSALGSGAVLVVAEGRDVLALATNLVRFFRNESCGKCVPCRVGSTKAVEILERALAGGPADEMALLQPLHETLALTSICGRGQVALVPAISALAAFPRAAARGPAGG
jgi:formate dehydrogenase